MVVKEKRGRKRYVLFTHPKKLTKKEAYNFFDGILSKKDTKIKILDGAMGSELISLGEKLPPYIWSADSNACETATDSPI